LGGRSGGKSSWWRSPMAHASSDDEDIFLACPNACAHSFRYTGLALQQKANGPLNIVIAA
jgi:hypothetical protein